MLAKGGIIFYTDHGFLITANYIVGLTISIFIYDFWNSFFLFGKTRLCLMLISKNSEGGSIQPSPLRLSAIVTTVGRVGVGVGMEVGGYH